MQRNKQVCLIYRPIEALAYNKGAANDDEVNGGMILKTYFRCVMNLCDAVNKVKLHLDRLWQYQDIVYDYKAEIHGTGSRSLRY